MAIGAESGSPASGSGIQPLWMAAPGISVESHSHAGGPQKPPKKKKSPTNILIGVLGGLCAVTIITLSVLLAMAWDGGIDSPATSGGTGSPNSSVHNGDAPKLQINELDENAEGLSTRDIVKKNLESTVILSIYDGQGSYGMGEQQSGEASGIVMTSDGYIITNWHCVVNEDSGKEYSRIAVTMHDGTVYDKAEIVGYDKSTDLAVIRVAAMNLTPAEFGDSSQLDIGDQGRRPRKRGRPRLDRDAGHRLRPGQGRI